MAASLRSDRSFVSAIPEARKTRQARDLWSGGVHVWRGGNGQVRKWSGCPFARLTKMGDLPPFWKIPDQSHKADLLPTLRISDFDDSDVPFHGVSVGCGRGHVEGVRRNLPVCGSSLTAPSLISRARSHVDPASCWSQGACASD